MKRTAAHERPPRIDSDAFEVGRAWWLAHFNPDDPRRKMATGTGTYSTTSSPTFSEVCDLRASGHPRPKGKASRAFERWLESADVECRRMLQRCADPSVKLSQGWYAEQVLKLIADLRAAQDGGSVSEVASLSALLADHMTAWRIKDHTEVECIRGSQSLRNVRNLAAERHRQTPDDSQAAAWNELIERRRPGLSKADVLRQIARYENSITPEPLSRTLEKVKKRVYRLRKKVGTHRR